jgi:YHS domain-containing protein
MDTIFSLLLIVVLFGLMMKFGCGAHARRGGGCGHASHHSPKTGDETSSRNTAGLKNVLRDPVCGMNIEISRAEHTVDYGRETYYFCSKDCARKFSERPEYFVETTRTGDRYVA